MSIIPAEFIRQKRSGRNHPPEELKEWLASYVKDELPDYQMAAWLMAVYFKGMANDEINAFTQIMRDSGFVFDFKKEGLRCIDKHSTGGVGDKASLILGPVAAAAGVHIPMIAGRGLGFTGGTLDKLEALSGFNINLSKDEFATAVRDHRIAIIGQTEDICPADKRLYALRDVTGTVESLPLICGSIMSKKLAEGLSGLVLDVKVGSGAFMKTFDEAQDLAKLLKTTGEQNGLEVVALITDMNQPLGRYVGNAYEVKECIDIMQGKECIEGDHNYYASTKELSLTLAAHMIKMSGLAKEVNEARKIADDVLESGKAYSCFEDMCKRQGVKDFTLPTANKKMPIIAEKDGYIKSIQADNIGLAAIELKAGRRKSSDKVDPSTAIQMNCYLGQKVSKGQVLIEMLGNDEVDFQSAKRFLLNSISISTEPLDAPPLVHKIL